MGDVAARRSSLVGAVLVALAAPLAPAGCEAPPPSRGDASAGPATPDEPALCSQMHRDLTRWQGEESTACGPDLSRLVEMVPLGNGRLLVHKRFALADDVWTLSPDGALDGPPVEVTPIKGSRVAALALLPGEVPRVLFYSSRIPELTLFHVQDPVVAGEPVLISGELGAWGPAGWRSINQSPLGHRFIGLPDGYLLDCDRGTGDARVWRFGTGPNGNMVLHGPAADAGAASAPGIGCRRGRRLLALGAGRLLAWAPRACAAGPDGSHPGCAGGADFEIWDYATTEDERGPRIQFAAAPSAAGFWPDVDARHDLLSDERHLFVWTRATGELRAYPLLADAADPLSATPRSSPPEARLRSVDWDPPTESPALKHLVFVLQDGRSFDSYFGSYCQGDGRPGGEAPACTEGPACCERMPASVPGAAACHAIDGPVTADDAAYQPEHAPACLRAKMNGGAMDRFALRASADDCGDPRDFACAAPPDAPGALATYHRWAARGALADRFFQTYAFTDGEPPQAGPEPTIQNLIYFVTARFSDDLASLFSTPLLTHQLARLEVDWAVYAGPRNLTAMIPFGPPWFHDPNWTPFRALEADELAHDIAAGALPSVSVVLPDAGDAARSEAPGVPFGPGVAFVQRLVDQIEASPYREDTLLLISDLTAGGYYDHVAPPAAPPLDVDATQDGRRVRHGPRVPCVALGRFARAGAVSHVPLEISSVTRFVEWNWMRNNGLKGARETTDPRRYRDTFVNNLGSLLDATQVGVEVPSGAGP